jgi:excisionase family DNA binding protein
MNAILKTSTASEIMTTSEVSDFLSVHRSTVHKMRERGDIVAYKFGKRVYFRSSIKKSAPADCRLRSYSFTPAVPSAE